MSTRLDVKNDISAHLNDAVFYTDTDLNESIQDGYNESVLLTRAIEKRYTLNLIANLVYYKLTTYMTDLYSVTQIFLQEHRRWLIPKSQNWLDRHYKENWELAIGSPIYFTIVNYERIGICPHPAAAAGSLDIYYKASAPTMTSDTNVFDIPNADHVMQKYVITDLLAQAQEFTKASGYYKKYIDQIKQVNNRIGQRNFPDKMQTLGGY